MAAEAPRPLPLAGAAPEAWERDAPITVDSLRGGLLESRHVVYGAVLDGRAGATRRRGWGEPGFLTFGRSAWKPFQALPVVLDGAADAFGFGARELALAVSSHSGTPQHLEVLAGMLAAAGLSPDALRSPGHPPLDAATAKGVRAWDRRHDNCSGKHAAMLAWCRHAAADPTGYTRLEHPVQDRILSLVCALSGLPRREVGVAFDGCTAPAFAVPLAVLARLFFLLGVPSRLAQATEGALGEAAPAAAVALRRLQEAMAAEPFFVAGEGRIDTDLVRATTGRIVSKSGAEGVWCGVDRERRVAFAFKAIDGGFRAAVPAALAALDALGLFSGAERQALMGHFEPVVRDRAGGAVGSLRARLPEPRAGAG